MYRCPLGDTGLHRGHTAARVCFQQIPVPTVAGGPWVQRATCAQAHSTAAGVSSCRRDAPRTRARSHRSGFSRARSCGLHGGLHGSGGAGAGGVRAGRLSLAGFPLCTGEDRRGSGLCADRDAGLVGPGPHARALRGITAAGPSSACG